MAEESRVLIIGDDPSQREVLVNILSAKGYRVVTAATGKEALEKVKEDMPALALIDLNLDDISTLEVMRETKERSPGTECIILTGFPSRASAIEAVNLGAYTYLQKPCDMDQLLVTIQRALEKREAEKAIRESEERYRLLLNDVMDHSQIGTFILDSEFRVVWVNQTLERYFGLESKEVIGKDKRKLVQEQISHIFEDPEVFEEKVLAAYEDNTYIENFECHVLPDAAREERWLEHWSRPIQSGLYAEGRIELYYDITDRKKLEEQLRQSQKMEAIGTLAGGVAHDFNNLLTTIIGNADLALMDIRENHPLYEPMKEIMTAGQNAASLTRQLLAFSRKQIIHPEVVDLNEVLTGIERMLARLLREDIELVTILEPSLWELEIDPAQIEQVIMNLAVNAGDAMPKGGRLTIETANVDLDEGHFRDHAVQGNPGPYVMLAASDTGVGMDKEIQSRIFDPFFTTKERGKGTGLGLSTVYGIVKQNEGFIWAYSKPGQGATFKIYLPRVEIDRKQVKKKRIADNIAGGSETVLIVEDDDSLRNLSEKVLQRCGYRVLTAQDGEEALKVSDRHEGPLHLVLADVVMPGMSGHELAERLQSLRPQIKVIYMSGYTDNAIVHHGVIDSHITFIEKPFSPETMARKVREVLDGNQA